MTHNDTHNIYVPGGAAADGVRAELEAGRSGVEIAMELYGRFREAGLNDVYLVPPIRRGGARDYGAAREFLGRASGQ